MLGIRTRTLSVMTSRLIRWDRIEVRLDCQRLTEEAAMQARAAGAPVSDLRLDCAPGELSIRGRVHKFVAVPFNVSIRSIVPEDGLRIRVHLDSATAFGVPLPTLLVGLVESRMPKLLTWDPATHSLVVDLEQILPSFVDAEVSSVELVEGAILIDLGPGGADPPPQTGRSRGGHIARST